MIYPVFSADQRYVGFLLKPLGVDQLDFHFPTNPNQEVVAQSYLKDSLSSKFFSITTFLHYHSMGIIADIAQCFSIPTGKSYNTNKKLPTHIEFFRRNVVNGVCGEPSHNKVKIIKNKVNAELYFSIFK